LDTLALSPERQSVQMSEIKNAGCRLDRDDIDHFYKFSHLMPLHLRVNTFELMMLMMIDDNDLKVTRLSSLS